MAIKLSGSTIIDDSRNIVNAGIVTATSFDGDGSGLSGIVTSITAGTGITISGSTGNVTINASGGGGSSTFLGLSDTPGSFGTAGQVLAVNSGADALEFVTPIALTNLSVTQNAAGTAGLSYNNTTGAFTYTPPDLSSYLTSYTVTASDLSGISIDALSDVDTSSAAPTDGQALLWNDTNSQWEPGTVSSGGGGSTTFLALTDTPGSFTASKFLAVNSGGTALEFVDAPSGGSTTFLALTDTPGSFTASKFLAINSAGDAIEFVDAPSGGGGISLTDLSITTAGTASGGGSLAYDNITGVFTFTPAESGGGGGSSTFLGLSDTPGSFTASKFLAINSAGDAIEFVDAPSGGGGSTTFLALTDTPGSFGTAGQVLAVNSGGDGLEFVTASSGGGGGGISVGTRTGAVDNEDLVTGVTELRFAKAPFTVSDLGDGKVLLLTESSFNPIQVNGAAGVTASGEETLNLVAGDGITIVADNTSTPKKLTFTASGGGGGGGGATTLADLTDVDLTLGTLSNGKVLKYNETQQKWYPATDSTGSGGGGGGGGDGTAFLGESSRGTYDGGLLTLTTETQINDAIDQLNQIMVKLAPPTPQPLSTQTLSLVGKYSATIATSSPIKPGEVHTDVIDQQSPTTSTVSGSTGGFYDGANGVLSFWVNGTQQASIPLSSGSNKGPAVDGLTILTDEDPYAGVQGQQNFWEQLEAKGQSIADLAVGEEHTYEMRHSLTGNTPLYTFFVDNPSSPTVSGESVDTTAAAAAKGYVSGVPTYTTSTPVEVSFTISGAVSKAHSTNKVGDITNTNVSTSNIAPDSAGYAEGADITVTSQPVSFQSNKYTENITVSLKGYNSKGSAGTPTTLTIPGRLDTKSNESSRITSGSGQYPASGYGDSYDSNQSLANNEELQLLNGKYVYPSADYSGWEGGPDYSSLSGMRYVTFAAGTASNALDGIVTVTATGVSPDPTNATIAADMVMYLKIEGVTGWLNINEGPNYSGGNLSADGDKALLYPANPNPLVKNLAYGQIPLSGSVFVRLGLPAGSNIQITNATYV